MESTTGIGHAVVAAKPPALALDAALLVAALMAGLAVPGLKAVVGRERRSSGRSRPGERPNSTCLTALLRLS